MRKPGPKKRITAAIRRVTLSIHAFASQGPIAGGLSPEGYAGGYRDGLTDALLVISGVRPSRREYWGDWEEEQP